jgi:hypothetical protein
MHDSFPEPEREGPALVREFVPLNRRHMRGEELSPEFLEVLLYLRE